MKKYGLIILLISLLCITSCSQVFEAGVSGKLVTIDSGNEQGAGDVYVYSYTDKSVYEKDLAKFIKGEITRPTEGTYVPATTTTANGEFTISKIVWKSNKGMFGKTADVVDLYLIFYHEDFKPCGFGPISVISGSTNSSAVKQTIEQIRFPMPAFASQISKEDNPNNKNTTAEDSSLDEYDNVRLILTDSDFNTFEGKGASVYTVSAEHGDFLSYSHGHFSGLGAGLKWEYPDGKNSIIVNIVWDANDNGVADTGELYYPVTVSRTNAGIPSKITFTKTK